LGVAKKKTKNDGDEWQLLASETAFKNTGKKSREERPGGSVKLNVAAHQGREVREKVDYTEKGRKVKTRVLGKINDNEGR